MYNTYVKPQILLVMVFVLLLLVQPLAGTAAAGSLWSDSGPGASLYADHRAHAVGDILTIVISESFAASRTGAANNTKASSTSMDAGTGIFKGITSASAGNSDSFKAQGSLTNSNTVSGRMTVAISEIRPNGNLLISGSQMIKQNGEEQKIIVSGEVRPDDITPDNTVLSSFVANAQIHVDGKGPLSEKQRQGIISQLLNFLF
ncbi:MAG: flagellar basal body L-ring protein FlgH [Negativicutes bacterium]|nr:flagellar basal body L-ring protein FlgH [Negativicutes bacterium]MDR3592634.1 flagellar basal body L-ring protein FlgH [Negativicutes bacterium]